MTTPDYQTLMRPLMAELTDGQSQRPRDLTDRMADVFDLTDEERAELHPGRP